MTERVKAAIEDEMIDAIRFAPAEDKVQLGMDTLGMPCIDSKKDTSSMLRDAQEMNEKLMARISELESGE